MSNDASHELAAFHMKQAVPLKDDMLSAELVKERVQLLQRVMLGVMKKDTHYGQIPGTQGNTLYKAGSEVILTTFRIAVVPEIVDLSSDDHVAYRVMCKGVHQVTGELIGVGVGECSSNEEKYKWRAASSQEEFDNTPRSRCRVAYKSKWGRGRGERESYTINQVRTEPADIANTVLKMAKKRAQIDMTLTCTAASDIFTQDLEDLPEHLRTTVEEAEQPRSAPEAQAAAQEPAENNEPVQTFEQVKDLIRIAQTLAQLNTAMDLIKNVEAADERADLRKAASRAGAAMREGGEA